MRRRIARVTHGRSDACARIYNAGMLEGYAAGVTVALGDLANIHEMLTGESESTNRENPEVVAEHVRVVMREIESNRRSKR
jgi:hypothetical protein